MTMSNSRDFINTMTTLQRRISKNTAFRISKNTAFRYFMNTMSAWPKIKLLDIYLIM